MRPFYVLLLLIVLLAVSCVFSIWKVQNVQRNQNTALHSIICFVQARELTSQQRPLTGSQRRQVIMFWDKALSNAHLPSCPS